MAEEGLDPQTKVAFAMTHEINEEEQAFFSTMTKQQLIEYLRKKAEEKFGKALD